MLFVMCCLWEQCEQFASASPGTPANSRGGGGGQLLFTCTNLYRLHTKRWLLPPCNLNTMATDVILSPVPVQSRVQYIQSRFCSYLFFIMYHSCTDPSSQSSQPYGFFCISYGNSALNGNGANYTENDLIYLPAIWSIFSGTLQDLRSHFTSSSNFCMYKINNLHGGGAGLCNGA